MTKARDLAAIGTTLGTVSTTELGYLDGVASCKSLFGEDTNWVQTSYNGNFRGTFAGVGMKYDPDKDEFISE